MNGCSILLRISLSVNIYFTIPSVNIFFLSKTFIASLFPVLTWSTRKTDPKEPYPSKAIGLKSITVNYRGFKMSSTSL